MEARVAWAPEGLRLGMNRNVQSRLRTYDAERPRCRVRSCEITEGGDSAGRFSGGTCHFCPSSPFAQIGDPVQLETNFQK